MFVLSKGKEEWGGGVGVYTYSADNITVVGEMCLAVLTAEDFGRVQVEVVCQAHLRYSSARAVSCGLESQVFVKLVFKSLKCIREGIPIGGKKWRLTYFPAVRQLGSPLAIKG
jgi:hypothetical protein